MTHLIDIRAKTDTNRRISGTVHRSVRAHRRDARRTDERKDIRFQPLASIAQPYNPEGRLSRVNADVPRPDSDGRLEKA